jgi:integrase/recombinase XerD
VESRQRGGHPSRAQVSGPLAAFAGAFGKALSGKGYSARSAAGLMGLAAKLSGWLQSRGLCAADVTAAVIGEFFAERRRNGCARWRTSRSLALLAECMGIAPGGTAGGLLARYRVYLLAERGLAASTTDRYLRLAGAFLAWLPGGEEGVAGLEASQVVAYVMEECPRHGGARAKLIVTALRSLLRFLHASGRVPYPLAAAVPSVPGWKLAPLPPDVNPDHVAALLASCDRRSAAGRRDYAILVLLSRLGLRAGEVAAIELGDVDWRAGELMVRGKGSRRERLPLPADAGEALADYVRYGRPRCAGPRLLVILRAPYTGLSARHIFAVVARACRRAGLPPFGPHRLRHAVACDLLRHGASLAEVGQLLRHRDERTTAIYAKVDLDALRGLARPCPPAAGAL